MAMTPEEKRARDRENHAKWRAANRPAYLAYQRARYVQDREDRIAYRMLKAHGLRPEDWASIWEAQDGKCYLCGKPLAGRIHVDHDHRHCGTNASCAVCRRGIACNCCNVAIGMAQDDPDHLRRMADALEAAQLAVTKRLATAAEQLTFDTNLIAS